MDLRKLEYFESVARLKNFTKAAEELHVSQPSITTAIRTLEQSLGVILLRRTQRQVNLTAEGEILYQKAVGILSDVRNAMQQMVDLGNASNQIIRIGIVPILGAALYPLMFAGFLEQHPGVHFHITESGTHGVMDGLLKNDIELGYITFPEQQDEAFCFAQTMEGEVHVLLERDNPLCRYERIPFAQLAIQPIIYLPTHSFLRRAVDNLFAKHGAKPLVVHEPTQMITTFELVAAGLGVSFVLHNQMHMVRDNAMLVSRPMEDPLPYQAGFAWNRGAYLSSISRKLVDYVTFYMKSTE